MKASTAPDYYGYGPSAATRYLVPAVVVLACQIVSIAYFYSAFRAAASLNLLPDEVLAVWAARLSTASQVISAIWKGAEYSPPSYDLLLHYIFGWFGSTPSVARVPSIIAIYLSAMIMGLVVGRRLGPTSGALAFSLTLNSPLYEYAIQARPYGLLVLSISAAALLWDGATDERRISWRAAGIGLALFIAVSLHFYAITDFALFAIMEGLWGYAYRKIRWPIWGAILAAACASALWLPLMLHLAGFNGADAASPAFYAAPTVGHLAEHVTSLLLGHLVFGLVVFAIIFFAAVAHAIANASNDLSRRQSSDATVSANSSNIIFMGVALLSALPVGFLLALFVTHAFSARYALPTTLGAILLLVVTLRRLPYHTIVATLLLAILGILPLIRGNPTVVSHQALELLHRTSPTGPIAVTEGGLFLELMASADPALQGRLVFVRQASPPTGVEMTADHQVMRLKNSFRPDLRVEDLSVLAQSYSPLTVLVRPSYKSDWLGSWLMNQNWVDGVNGFTGDIALLSVKSPSPASAR